MRWHVVLSGRWFTRADAVGRFELCRALYVELQRRSFRKSSWGVVKECLAGGCTQPAWLPSAICLRRSGPIRRTSDEIEISCAGSMGVMFRMVPQTRSATRGMDHIIPPGDQFLTRSIRQPPSQAAWRVVVQLARKYCSDI